MNRQDRIRAALGEFVGTGILMFVLITMSIQLYSRRSETLVQLSTGFVAFITLFVAIFIATRFSPFAGQLNPAVTLGMTLSRRLPFTQAILHITIQIITAILAVVPGSIAGNLDVWRWGFRLETELGSGRADQATYGLPRVAPVIEPWVAGLLEMGFVALLVTTVFLFAWRMNRHPAVWGFFASAVFGVGVAALYALTGGSLNPARYIGPALIAWEFTWWGAFVYVLAPTVATFAVYGLEEASDPED